MAIADPRASLRKRTSGDRRGATITSQCPGARSGRGSILGDHGARERAKARGFGRPVVGRRAARDVDGRGGPGRPRWGFGYAPRRGAWRHSGANFVGLTHGAAILRRRRRLCASRLFPAFPCVSPLQRARRPCRYPRLEAAARRGDIFTATLRAKEPRFCAFSRRPQPSASMRHLRGFLIGADPHRVPYNPLDRPSVPGDHHAGALSHDDRWEHC